MSQNPFNSISMGPTYCYAKEERVLHPTSFDFISNYKLSSPSSVKRSLDALLDKEMALELNEGDQKYYRIYDVFLGRWMQRKSF